MAALRYKVVDDTNTACQVRSCFKAAVVDTYRPVKIGLKDSGKFEAIGECFTFEDAAKIAKALNTTWYGGAA